MKIIIQNIQIMFMALVLSCSPTKEKTTRPTSGIKDGPSGSEADPFTGLLISDAHLPWVFKHGVGPKPPAAGFEKMMKFPQPPEPPKVAPLVAPKVLRVQPTGEIENTRAISVVFSQPMVPLASVDQMRELEVPAKLEPAIPGRWRWLGTTLLVFEPAGPLPGSTHFSVTIPKGTKSALGTEIADTVKFTFSTSPLYMGEVFPQYQGGLPDSPVVIHFSQRVDPNLILKYVSLERENDGEYLPIKWKILTKEQFQKNEIVRKFELEWEENQTLALLPTSPLPKNRTFVVTLKKGAPSAEGPRRTEDDQTRNFGTIGPMKVNRITCVGRSRQLCRPNYYWSFEFSNEMEIEDEALQKYFVVTPAVKNLKVESWGSRGIIRGEFQPATTYSVKILAGIEDIYKQKLDSPAVSTIRVDDEYPELQMHAYQMAVLEENNRILPVPVVNNLRPATVKLFSVAPKDLFSALSIANDNYNPDEKSLPTDPLGKPVVTFKQQFNSKRNQRELAQVDLDKALRKKNGILFVEIDSPSLSVQRDDSPYRRLLVQVTSLGLTVFSDPERLHILATGLGDGKPRASVPIRIYQDPFHRWAEAELIWEGKTGADGTVSTPWPAKLLNKERRFLILGGTADDLAFLQILRPLQTGEFDSTYDNRVGPRPQPSNLRTMVFTDRNPYRPGERVEFNGWLRDETEGPEGRLGHVVREGLEAPEVQWMIFNPEYQAVMEGKTALDVNGTFHVQWKAPLDAMLGRYYFNATITGIRGHRDAIVRGEFSVLAYRTPEHVVNVTIPPRNFIFGDRFIGQVEGRYTFGAPMRDADVEYIARLVTSSYEPPKNPDFDFGYYNSYWGPGSDNIVFSGQGKLDGNGFLKIEHEIKKPNQPKDALSPAMIMLEARVIDVNRQSISARSQALVHPSGAYLGLRTPQNLIREGEAITIEGVVADVEGLRRPGRPVKVRALKTSWKLKPADRIRENEDRYEEVTEEKGTCSFVSAAEPASCKLTITMAGYYYLEGSTTDEQGRPSVTRIDLYVEGKDVVEWSPDNEEYVQVALDHDEPYKPGEKAKLIIRAPFFPATGVLSLERQGIITNRVIHVKSSIHVEEIPIEEKHIPNLWATVALVRGRVKVAQKTDDDPGRPKLATGSVKIPISLATKTIQVAVLPDRNVLAPGETARLELRATDSSGAPVQARLAVMLVDEGVLSLLGYALPNPLAVFFPAREAWVYHDDVRRSLMIKPEFAPPSQEQPELEDSDEAGNYSYGMGGGSAMGVGIADGANLSVSFAPKTGNDDGMKKISAAQVHARDARSSASGAHAAGPDFSAITLRRLFASTAYFNDKVLTDANGRVSLQIAMPENLTTFRVMVMAMDAKAPDRFGSADNRITVRKEFMVRAALPRFANFGDTFEAAVVLNSLSTKEGPAEVKISGTGFQLLGPDVQSVQLSSQKSQELRFKIKTDRPGVARVTFAARHLGMSDGVSAPDLPIHVPASTENTAVYGMTDGAVLQPVVPPGKVFSQFGGLDLHVSSTGLSGLQDAARFLFVNDYQCSEAIASRLVPLAALRDIILQFKLGAVSSPEKLDKLAVTSIKELLEYQTWNGGFLLWPDHNSSWPFISVYITWALIRAREAGFAVPETNLRKAAEYLMDVLSGNHDFEDYWYYNHTSQIYAGWVLTELARMKVVSSQELADWQVIDHLNRLYDERKNVGFLARTWLLHAIWRLDRKSEKVQTLLRDLENSVVETAAGAHFAEVQTEGLALLMHSSARTDAVVLRVLLDIDPKHVLLSKIVRGLMSSRVEGGWETSQGNAFVLDALAAYFRVVEAEEPDFTMNAWYDTLFAGTKKFKGRSMDIVHARIPMKTLLEQGAGGILLNKDGPGKLYYRIGLAYVPAAQDLPAESQGITVSRTYESLSDDGSVVQVSPGKWRVRAGATVLVKLTVHVPDRRDYVALTDPLPAGFEGIDRQLDTAPQMPAKKKTGSSVSGSGYFWWWSRPTHQELRDDRFVAYYDSMYAGTYEYAYTAHATTLGTFAAPAVRALEMYHPEVFGRSAREVVEVVP